MPEDNIVEEAQVEEVEQSTPLSEEEQIAVEDAAAAERDAASQRLADAFPTTPPQEEVTRDAPWPLPVYPLTAKFDVQNVLLEDNSPVVVIAMYTGAGASFGLLSRDQALQLSSQLRKIANGIILP